MPAAWSASNFRGTPLEPLAETAELVVSEVVTNAIVHTGADIEVAASLDEDGLRVEVADSSTHLPVVASYDSLAMTGRGLRLVAELTDQWGVETRPDGKTFWFHLGLSVRGEGLHDLEISGADLSAPARGGRGNDVTVELLNMPARMHEAWQEHAKSLLRDLLLLGIDVAASDELEAHAAAMDALAILEEQVGTEAPDTEPDPLALTPEPATVKVRVVVPQGSVPHFETLDKQLDSALSLAHAGRLLAPPSQPEFDAFRRWIADQVREQAEGGPPRPWTAQATPTGPGGLDSEHAAAWDAAAVTASPRALIGADRAGLIVAASPAALALLRYDGPISLLGKKLADLVPTRDHQTHLAGFTLHQFNDRGPTLGLAVVVPVRRGDGTEAEVRLSLTASLGTDGASMLVAELQPATPPGR
ncbi:ATP-binding protein [Nocardioides sp.]|uniref:ATP-binding protein n=1 Tax=Nocardioides sp. TaxID=35761 RepID=UPI002BF62221|nr:ATP-binding protein [Nocardioides sp.]HXH79898.1 ATP-binding protein [Nocardioides sp.]